MPPRASARQAKSLAKRVEDWFAQHRVAGPSFACAVGWRRHVSRDQGSASTGRGSRACSSSATSSNSSTGVPRNPHNTTKTNLQADTGDAKYNESSQIVMSAFGRSREFMDFVFPAPHRAAADAGAMIRRRNTACTPTRRTCRCRALPAGLCGSDVVVHRLYTPIRRRTRAANSISPRRAPRSRSRARPAIAFFTLRPRYMRWCRCAPACGWFRSRSSKVWFADESKRNILYELNEVGALEGLKMQWESRVRFEAARQNLLRMWVGMRSGKREAYMSRNLLGALLIVAGLAMDAAQAQYSAPDMNHHTSDGRRPIRPPQPTGPRTGDRVSSAARWFRWWKPAASASSARGHRRTDGGHAETGGRRHHRRGWYGQHPCRRRACRGCTLA